MKNETSIKKILVIDDDEDDVLIFKEAIREVDLRIEVTHISDPGKLTRDETNIPDLVFLDINMPKWNGFEWLSLMKSKGCNVPVVMYSTSGSYKYIHQCYSQGVNLYFQKPSQFSVLSQSLKSILSWDWQYPKEITKRFTLPDKFLAFSIEA